MKKLFLSVLILCLAGLVGEIYLRAFDPQPTFRWYSYDQSGNRWNKGVSDTYFLLVPDLKGYITFNSRGERAEQNFSLMKNSEAKRVLLLGTSLTMGWPANRGVSELLTERFSKSGEKADVINCSTGYSNLATLLNVYKVHCPYESLDALVVAVPLNAFVDGLAANSFLWGENFIDDPSKLAYLLRYSEPSKIQLSHDESGVPSFVLSEAEQAKVADYYTGSWFFYDHFHLARLIYNRYVYTSIVFDKTFQRNYKDYFDRSFKSMPTLDTTYGLVDRFRKMAGPQTKLIVLLIPTYHAMILEPSTREKVLLELQKVPLYESMLKSPDTFIQKHYGNLGLYLDDYVGRLNSFKQHFAGSDVKVIDMSDDFKKNSELKSLYVSDQYHLSMKGQEALADALFRELSPVWP